MLVLTRPPEKLEGLVVEGADLGSKVGKELMVFPLSGWVGIKDNQVA
jgi:hypothetical protein